MGDEPHLGASDVGRQIKRLGVEKEPTETPLGAKDSVGFKVSIGAVAQDRIPMQGTLHPELVGTAGLGLKQQRGQPKVSRGSRQHTKMRHGHHRWPTRGSPWSYRFGADAFRSTSALGQEVVPGAATSRHGAGSDADCQVAFDHASAGEFSAGGFGRSKVGCDEDDAAGRSIESVDEPDATDAPGAVAHMVALLV
jgi:hypothetical protein